MAHRYLNVLPNPRSSRRVGITTPTSLLKQSWPIHEHTRICTAVFARTFNDPVHVPTIYHQLSHWFLTISLLTVWERADQAKHPHSQGWKTGPHKRTHTSTHTLVHPPRSNFSWHWTKSCIMALPRQICSPVNRLPSSTAAHTMREVGVAAVVVRIQKVPNYSLLPSTLAFAIFFI